LGGIKEKPVAQDPKKVFVVLNQQIFPIEKPIVTIGRNMENDIVINDKYVSRHHAEIRLEDGKFHIHDLDSTSGTSLNRKRVQKSLLYSGDLISVAHVPLMFIDEGWTLENDPDMKTGELKKK
jgi:pSer/pThr/pTyr-binding forkhead associated (FHA) protein